MQLLIDLRYAARQLTRSPGLTVSVVLILGLGLGVTTAVVSAVDHVLLRPLDLPDSERLVTLCEVRNADRTYCSVSPPNMLDWLASARALEAGGVARDRSLVIHDAQGRTPVYAAMATPGFLQALGVAPLHGRLLHESDMLPHGSARVVVLSHALWQEQFGGDPSIVGRSIRVSSDGDGQVLDDDAVTVVGVLPDGVEVPRFASTRAWLPLQLDARAEENRDWRGFVALARLAPGVGITDAAVELNRVQAALADAYPEQVRNWTVDVHRLRDYVSREARPLLLLFLAAVVVVLAIVCVNVVTLLLARATRRERELTVLAALGAGRARLARQLLVEALLLAAAGGVAGGLLALWLIKGLVLAAPPGVPRLDEIALDARVLAIMALVTLLIGVAFGAIPAIRLKYAQLNDVLRQGRMSTGDRQGRRIRRVLVVSQLALALTLLLSAALLTRSFGRLVAYDPGFEIDGLLTFQVYPPMARYDTPERRRDFYGEVEAALRAAPGVAAVGSASAGPLLGGGDGRTPFLVWGAEEVALEDAPTAEWFDAGPGYFPALGMPIVMGRNLSAQPQTGDAIEALVNEAMARRHWPGTSPLGARLSLPGWDVEAQVVGVVPDMRLLDQSPPEPAIYVSNVQRPRGASFFVVRASGEPAALMPAVRQVLARIDADVPPQRMATMPELLRGRLVGPRFNLLLIGVFALLALLLSAAGVYALVAYTVTMRTREFGIRLALGARASQVLLAVMLDTGRLLAAGLVIGGLGALFFTRLLRGFIQDVAPTDASAVAFAVVLLGVAAVAAAAGPALRAARTQPATVLRAE